GADLLLGVQSGPALVAQARARDRSLLLVRYTAGRALSAYRVPDHRCRASVWDHRRARAGRVLRRWPRATCGVAAVAAGSDLPDRIGPDDVLAAPRLSSPGDVEVPRHPPFIEGSRLDFGRALSSGQHHAWQRRDRCRAALGRNFTERPGAPGTVHDRPFGVR